MDPFTISDLFFIVATLAIIFIAAILAVALFYFIVFIRMLTRIAGQASRATKFVVDDLGELSKNIRQNGFRLGKFLQFLFGMQSKAIKKVKELPDDKVKTK
jgi:hypothetical protein